MILVVPIIIVIILAVIISIKKYYRKTEFMDAAYQTLKKYGIYLDDFLELTNDSYDTKLHILSDLTEDLRNILYDLKSVYETDSNTQSDVNQRIRRNITSNIFNVHKHYNYLVNIFSKLARIFDKMSVALEWSKNEKEVGNYIDFLLQFVDIHYGLGDVSEVNENWDKLFKMLYLLCGEYAQNTMNDIYVSSKERGEFLQSIAFEITNCDDYMDSEFMKIRMDLKTISIRYLIQLTQIKKILLKNKF